MSKQGDGEDSQKAFRMVEVGLKLDSNNRDEEAYIQYLNSVEFIAKILGQATVKGTDSSTVNRVKKLVSVARQCLDRSEALVEKLNTVSVPVTSVNGGLSVSKTQLPLLSSPEDKKTVPKTSVSCYSFSDLTGEIPLEVHTAYRENRKLESVYKVRMDRAPSAFHRSNLSLELERRIAENVQLARSRDLVRIRQIQEQRQRLLRQAEMKISKMGPLSKEEQTKKQVFADILQYHQHQKWPTVLKQMLVKDSYGPDSVEAAVSRTLSTTEHPLCQLLLNLRSDVHDQVRTLANRMSSSNAESLKDDDDRCHRDKDGLLTALQRSECKEPSSAAPRQLSEIVGTVKAAVKILVELLVLAYEAEDANSGQDVWNPFVEDAFLIGIWDPLLRVFRLVNQEEEWTLKQVMAALVLKTPSELGINAEFCNLEKLKNVACQLCTIGRMSSPLRKLARLVSIARVLCEDPSVIKKSLSEEAHSVGADDLIPMLAYIIVQSQFAPLITECRALEEFISESCLMGEEGYCLTSVQTAVHYLNTLVLLPPSHRRQHST